jgi:hypothetical protein
LEKEKGKEDRKRQRIGIEKPENEKKGKQKIKKNRYMLNFIVHFFYVIVSYFKNI